MWFVFRIIIDATVASCRKIHAKGNNQVVSTDSLGNDKLMSTGTAVIIFPDPVHLCSLIIPILFSIFLASFLSFCCLVLSTFIMSLKSRGT